MRLLGFIREEARGIPQPAHTVGNRARIARAHLPPQVLQLAEHLARIHRARLLVPRSEHAVTEGAEPRPPEVEHVGNFLGMEHVAEGEPVVSGAS